MRWVTYTLNAVRRESDCGRRTGFYERRYGRLYRQALRADLYGLYRPGHYDHASKRPLRLHIPPIVRDGKPVMGWHAGGSRILPWSCTASET